MARILANDGLHAAGVAMLKEAGHEVSTDNIPMDQLNDHLNEWDAIIVRSATKVRKETMDLCPNLKMVVRAGVGMDNIDVEYGRDKGVNVQNTPEASSRSVAELAMAHLFGIARFLNDANFNMPAKGNSEFKALKKSYSKGFELQGKTMGIIGFGRIGQELAKLSLGIGMKVMAADLIRDKRTLQFPEGHSACITEDIEISSFEELISQSDVISVHVPTVGKALLANEQFAKMKKGVVLLNTARGGVIDEDDLLEALNSGQVGGAGLDVFTNEPTPRADLLNHPRISVSPHIGASTVEAQEKIARLAAQKLIDFFK